MTIATIEELAYLMKQAKEEGLPQPIVFLGAGASKTAGVPLASEIINDILEKYKSSPKIKALGDEPKTYAKLMECLTPFERNKLLKGYIDNAKINVTHLYLAQLLIEGYIDYVLTVNFDNLMLRALALFNSFPATYDMAILKDLTTTSFKEKSVVYLHGQHHGLWLLNTVEEMTKVNEIIPPILNGIKDQRPWIFIGYSGEDPIFDHIIKLGRFDNGLYWITYNDNNPNKSVCDGLLEKPNTNTHLIKGFDSDSFILKLNAELNLSQPIIIDKPFSSLKNTLQNIVDIDDKEHFKGVKERLEIAKNNVENAISQFEKGEIKLNKKLKQNVNIDLLKKQIINLIIKDVFVEKEINTIEESAKKLKNEDINKLLANLFRNWGDSFKKNLREKKEENILESIEKYKKALIVNQSDELSFNNWGNSLVELGKLKKDKKLFEESFEKYNNALLLNSKLFLTYNNWGLSIFELYRLTNDPDLIKESIDKYKKAIEINPDFAFAYHNWGGLILQVGLNDEKLLNESMELFEKASKLDPNQSMTYRNWGLALKSLAELKKNSVFYILSVEKYNKAIEVNSNESLNYKGLGNVYRNFAIFKNNDEKLFKKSLNAYKTAHELNPNSTEIYYEWALVFFDLYKIKKTDNLLQESLELFQKAISTGSDYYNLACIYSFINEKDEALKHLDISLERKEITVDFVKNDTDWINLSKDDDFKSILKKHI